jgi:rubrerythrin
MPLNNFGSICNFAEAMENLIMTFYEGASANPACADVADRYRQFAKDSRKHIQTLQRTRRENVTEMILEPIQDFYRAPYELEYTDPGNRTPGEILDDARRIAETAESFYQAATEKIRALPEVARALKTIGKKHTAHRRQLAETA